MAQKNFDPVLPPLPDDFEDELEEESVKIVRLVKNKEPLVSCWRCEWERGARNFPVSVHDRGVLSGLQGATIRRDDATGAVIVARIMRGGAADRSGKSSFSLAVCQRTTTDQHRVKLFSSYFMSFRVGNSEK